MLQAQVSYDGSEPKVTPLNTANDSKISKLGPLLNPVEINFP